MCQHCCRVSHIQPSVQLKVFFFPIFMRAFGYFIYATWTMTQQPMIDDDWWLMMTPGWPGNLAMTTQWRPTTWWLCTMTDDNWWQWMMTQQWRQMTYDDTTTMDDDDWRQNDDPRQCDNNPQQHNNDPQQCDDDGQQLMTTHKRIWQQWMTINDDWWWCNNDGQ